MRVAVIDCGTNTIRLYVADGVSAGLAETITPNHHALANCRLAEVLRRVDFVRLGEGVDATGEFSAAALERTFAMVDVYKVIMGNLQPGKLRFLATSATRDVKNREVFMEGIHDRLGVFPDVISGDEEAGLSFRGALIGGAISPGRVLVTDVGGGSTEYIVGTPTGRVVTEHSCDMGSVRIKERFFHHDPPTSDEVARARAFVGDLIDHTGVDFTRVVTWIGVAGTCTSLSAMNMGLTTYNRARVHNSTVQIKDVEALSVTLLGMTASQILQTYPILNPLRAEVIGAGSLICAETARRARVPMTVRESDILDGAAASLIAGD